MSPIAPRPPTALTELQRQTLAAVVARILPSGSTLGAGEAGAVEAGVAEACEKALSDRFLQPSRPYFEHGLDHLQAAARARYDLDFGACSPRRQDALLRALETDTDWRLRLFLPMSIRLALEGFLGDPVHGGNRGGVGWRFLGLDAGAVRSGFCQRELRG